MREEFEVLDEGRFVGDFEGAFFGPFAFCRGGRREGKRKELGTWERGEGGKEEHAGVEDFAFRFVSLPFFCLLL